MFKPLKINDSLLSDLYARAIGLTTPSVVKKLVARTQPSSQKDMSSTVQQNLQILKDRLWKFSNPLEKFFENLGKSQIVRHFFKNTLNTSCKFYKHFYRHFPILPRHSRCFLHTSKLYLYTHKMLCTHFFIKNTANNLGHFPNTLQNILDILWKISKHL